MNRQSQTLRTRVRSDRPFVNWLLQERRRERANASTAVAVRVTEASEERVTEDGQMRET
jgi:hypothetical protein